MIWFHLSMRIADIRWSVLTYLMEKIGMGFSSAIMTLFNKIRK